MVPVKDDIRKHLTHNNEFSSFTLAALHQSVSQLSEMKRGVDIRREIKRELEREGERRRERRENDQQRERLKG